MVLELVDGDAVDARRRGTLTELVDAFSAAAEALHAMHRQGYVHCDLKPGNILVSGTGGVKVIDFGQACRAGTAKQRIQGTPDYIAPEQVRLDPVTPRTDVYGLGATLYATLVGRPVPTLYTAGRRENSFLVDDAVQTPHQADPNVPENLSNLVMECLRSNPGRRPESMADLARRLQMIRQ